MHSNVIILVTTFRIPPWTTTTRDASRAIRSCLWTSFHRTCYHTFELGKAGPELELHRLSYRYISGAFEAAAEAVPALSSEAFSSNTMLFIYMYVISRLCFPSGPLFQLTFIRNVSRGGSRWGRSARADYCGFHLRKADR